LSDIVHRKKEEQEFQQEDPEIGDEADIATRSVEKELLFDITDSEKQNLDGIEAALRKIEKDFGAATAERDNVLKQVQALSEQVECRSYWPELLSSLRSILVNAETKTREAIKAKDKADVELGVWVEAFCPGLAADSKYVVSGQRYSMTTIQSEMSMASGSSSAASAPVATAPVASSKPNRGAPTQAASSADSSGEVSRIGVVFRGIDRDKAAPSANSDLAYNLREELLASGLFAEPIILGDIKKTETDAASAGTFSFNALLTLKRPLKL